MGYIQLRNYAEWYYTKYFPSRAMLRDKLEKKSEDSECVQKVLDDLSFLIVEDKIIESRVHAYLSQGRPARYIRLKLLQKKFDTHMVDNALAVVDDVLKNPNTYQGQIEKGIRKAFQKWVSKRQIQYELQMKYSDARELITEMLSEYDDREILQKKAPELLKKYTQEQVIWKLSQKGFQMSDIYTVVRRR